MLFIPHLYATKMCGRKCFIWYLSSTLSSGTENVKWFCPSFFPSDKGQVGGCGLVEFFCVCALPLCFKVDKHFSGTQYRVFSLETTLTF